MEHAQNWVVLKFGGTSVKSLADWRVISKRIEATGRENLYSPFCCSLLSFPAEAQCYYFHLPSIFLKGRWSLHGTLLGALPGALAGGAVQGSPGVYNLDGALQRRG